ncbi:MAG: DUF3999 domain-containing protein [Pseudomonadota bacterium]|nr:DUF3999 domain-containing protein [Pseudomonadota bacterium]
MRLAALLFAAALPAAAQPPSRFISSAELVLTGKEALHRLALPFEAYRDARRDLADVRVFNARGEGVPIAFAGDPDLQREVLPLVALAHFPISTLALPPGGRGAEVTVRTADGTLVSIRGRGGDRVARAVAYLLDATAVQEPLRALHVEWEAGAGAEVVKVRVEGSDDLKTWSALAAGPLVRVENAGRMLSQPRIEFPPRKVKYLRVTWDAPAFKLTGVRAEREPRTQPPPRLLRTVRGTPGSKPGEFLYDLGARLPVETYRLVSGEPNDVISAAITARGDETETWRAVGWAPFYRLRYEDAEKQSPPLEIGRLPARYWMARLAPGATSAAPPALEVQWRSHQLIFVARGEGPFALAFGNPQASAVALPVSALIPAYERLAELRLPAAKAGKVTDGPPVSRWDRLVGEANPRRLALWAILIGGVAVLGFMAWRLSRVSAHR